MTKETELKLRLSPDSVPALTDFLNSVAQPESHSTLKNWYLDTPDAGLAAQRAVLRIRENAGGFEQTLKTRGKSVAGLQIRGEWNWPVSGPQLNQALLQSSEVAASWPPAIDMSQLGEVFTTHFDRQAWRWQAHGCTAEVVIDQGAVRAGRQQLPLCEVELELKDGDAGSLWLLAQELARQVPLWLSDISKAERGYRLARLGHDWHLLPALEQNADLADALPQLLQYELLNLKRALEACLWDNSFAAALTAREHWMALRGLPQLAGKVIRRQQTRELRAALDHWEQPLLELATLAQAGLYMLAADDQNAVAQEYKALTGLWQSAVTAIRSDRTLASALLQAAHELYRLPALKSGCETAQHWLRHLLQQHSPLLSLLKSRRPQDEEQWRGHQHETALLAQLADYARALPGVARGIGLGGTGIGEGRQRVLAEMLGPHALLLRPWRLPETPPLRPAAEYSGWALEHLSHLAQQL